MKILLIDDDRDDGQLFSDVLQEIDPAISFEHFEDPRTALEKLSHSDSDLPDLIFLDINMPVISGWQCLNEFRKADHLRPIPVFMYTTSSQPREKEIANEMGAAGFITKPDDYNVLRERLREIVDEWRVMAM